MRRLPILVLFLFLSGCSSYWLPFPSGALEGEEATVPLFWDEIAQPEFCKLETLGDDPYTVNLWMIGMGTNLYVHAGTNYATWIENMENNPEVRIKIGDAIYPLKARRVTSQAEFDTFADVYEGKYGNRPRNENVNEAYLFNLIRR